MKIIFSCLCTLFTVLCSLQCTYATDYPQLFKEDTLYGYKNTEDEVIIPAEYLIAEEFSNYGYALVGKDVEGNGWPYEQGFIDVEGEVFIPLEYQHMTQFIEGFSLAQKNGKYGYLSADGTVAIDFIYDEASVFSGGKAVVKLNGEVLVIDRPNWETTNLSIHESDYIMLTSATACYDYLFSVVENSDTSSLNESDYLAIEKLLAHANLYMPSLNAEIQGNSIMILGENYSSVLSSCQDIYNNFSNLFNDYNMTITENSKNYLHLMEQGISNVTYDGESQPTRGDVTYSIVPFPIPYFNPSVYKSYNTNAQFTNYLSQRLQAMGDVSANKSGSDSLIEYINFIFNNLEPLYFTTRWNKVEIGTDTQKSYFDDVFELTTQITGTLAEYNVKTAENMSNTLLLLVDGNNLEKPIDFYIHGKYLQSYLGLIDGIRIVFGKDGEGIYFTGEDLRQIFNTYETLHFQTDFSQSDTVILTLYDTDEKTEIDEIPSTIFLSLPTNSSTASVFAFIPKQNTSNWGGLVKLNNTIEFATTYAGEYVTREADVNITDISELAVELQEKIKFMVSKGFFKVNTNGEFLPEESMTRTELITSLVKLFFLQDSTASSTFADVSPLQEDYPFISAAYQAGIATGYEDNTFRGDTLTTREVLVTFLASTLASRNGYKNVEDPNEVIKAFSDYQTIPSWAISSIALAIEHNLIDTTGAFQGSEILTRREIAHLLYTLFFKLFDSPNETVDFYTITEGKGLPIFFIAVTILIVVFCLIARAVKKSMDSKRQFKERMNRITSQITEDINGLLDEDSDDDTDYL